MIKLEIDSKHYDLTDDLKKRINDRIGGLDEFMDTLEEGHVTVSWEGGQNEQTKVRAQVRGGGHTFDGSDTDWKPITAVDKTRDELESQIRREQSKEDRGHDRHRE